jgi:aldehyde oxidoreductase
MKSIRLRVNGVWREVIAEQDAVLLEVLREDLRLTGAKQSCDRKGQCGACMVVVNGQAVRSCLAKMSDMEGADVITVEGLGTPDNPHLIQQAFVLSGAIQCGFCTPGMIMATKALLDADPNPSVDAITHALRRNLCRCTGYRKIIEAVQLAGRFLRGETTPEAVRPDPARGIMGVSHPRPTAMAKACGTATFTADYRIPGALELAVRRSDVPHARIVSIDPTAAEKMPGVAGVLTAAGVRGTNILKYLVADRPVLCRDKVRYIGDPILAVAADTRQHAEAALAAVQVVLEPLSTVDGPEAAMDPSAAQVHPEIPNLCYDQPQVKGTRRRPCAARRPSSKPASRPRSTTRPRWSPRRPSRTGRKTTPARISSSSWAAASTSTTTSVCCSRRSAGRTCVTSRPSPGVSSGSRST